MNTNLALNIEPTDLREHPALQPVDMDKLLRLGTGRINKRWLQSVTLGRRGPVRFEDNHSVIFHPFRIY